MSVILQGLFDYVHERHIGGLFPQHCVALGYKFVILLHISEILAVHLREDLVQELSALLSGIAHQGAVGRRHEHYRKEADVVGHPLAGLLVPDQFLGPVAGDPERKPAVRRLHRIKPRDGK